MRQQWHGGMQAALIRMHAESHAGSQVEAQPLNRMLLHLGPERLLLIRFSVRMKSAAEARKLVEEVRKRTKKEGRRPECECTLFQPCLPHMLASHT